MDKAKLTEAEIFAINFADQGDQFENEKGEWITDVLAKVTKKEQGTGDNIDCVRYVFSDQSAIVVSSGAWDVEANKFFVMESMS